MAGRKLSKINSDTFQINHYLDLQGIGQFRIYVDPQQDAKARALIKSLPQIMVNSYDAACKKYALEIVKKIKRCIETSTPPPGESWPALSESYVRRFGANAFYDMTGQYYNNIGYWQQKRYYSTGAFHKVVNYVGFRNGGQMKTKPMAANQNANITLLGVANILERADGTPGDGTIPPRRLWVPLFKNKRTGADKLKEYQIKALKDEIKKYIM